MSEVELRGKFERLTGRVGSVAAEQIVALVSDLQYCEDVGALGRLAA
jgi:hypothetical protein